MFKAFFYIKASIKQKCVQSNHNHFVNKHSFKSYYRWFQIEKKIFKKVSSEGKVDHNEPRDHSLSRVYKSKKNRFNNLYHREVLDKDISGTL